MDTFVMCHNILLSTLSSFHGVKNKESGTEQVSSDTSGVQIHKHRA